MSVEPTITGCTLLAPKYDCADTDSDFCVITSLFFVVAETLLFKAIVVPAILFAVIRRTKINRIAASGTSQFNSLVLSLAALATLKIR